MKRFQDSYLLEFLDIVHELVAILVGGKYIAKLIFVNSSYVVIVYGARELSHILAVSFRENGNNLRRMSSLVMPVYLNISQISKN